MLCFPPFLNFLDALRIQNLVKASIQNLVILHGVFKWLHDVTRHAHRWICAALHTDCIATLTAYVMSWLTHCEFATIILFYWNYLIVSQAVKWSRKCMSNDIMSLKNFPFWSPVVYQATILVSVWLTIICLCFSRQPKHGHCSCWK